MSRRRKAGRGRPRRRNDWLTSTGQSSAQAPEGTRTMTRTSDRRTFLLQATAVGLGAITPPASRAEAPAGETITCAVIGTGGRARSFTVPLATRDDTRVAAVC